MSVVDVVTDGPLLVAAPIAATAGLLSFLSPCVLPLVPGYLSFVTGLSGADLQERAARPAPRRRRAAARKLQPVAVPAGATAGPTTAGPTTAGPMTAGPMTAGPTTAGTAAAVATEADDAVDAADTDAAETGGHGSQPARVTGIRRVGRVTVGTTLFILGFTAVFVSYGAAFGGLGKWLVRHQVGLSQVLGVVTIVMGLGFAGVFSRLSWANREWRLHRLPTPGILGAPALGVLFGLGWTPCIGPTLSAVLGLAMQSATAGRGAFLSAAYCLGLGLPFLVVGLAFRRAAGALRAVRRHARLLSVAGGAMLVAVGILQLTGEWGTLIAELRPYAPGFSETPL